MKPLKFNAFLKQTIWGGNKIIPFKHLDSQLENVGESWEISGVKDHQTIVSEGEYAGRALNEVVEELKGKLIGESNYEQFGNEFPLLIKFIDARQDLSIQVHPTDEIAKKQGKSKKKITPAEYKEMVENDTILDAIADYSVKEGDCFFLPAGRIHSIGKGCFLAEIQQTSDVTYRIYDFKRKDKNGNYRELHTDLAAECINYEVLNDYRTVYTSQKNQGVSLVHCPYFHTAVYDLDEPMTLDYSELDSFVILIGVKGEGTIVDNEGNETSLRAGETILIPATTNELKVNGTVKFLETYV